MDEIRKKKLANWILILFVVLPTMMASGMIRGGHLLPFSAWVAISGVGGALAGALNTRRYVAGGLCGLLMSVGAILVLRLHIQLRLQESGDAKFLNFELLLAAAMGAVPGFILYSIWAKE